MIKLHCTQMFGNGINSQNPNLFDSTKCYLDENNDSTVIIDIMDTNCSQFDILTNFYFNPNNILTSLSTYPTPEYNWDHGNTLPFHILSIESPTQSTMPQFILFYNDSTLFTNDLIINSNIIH